MLEPEVFVRSKVIRKGGKVAATLYENGKKIGEVEDWAITVKPAESKKVLGKEFVTTPSSNQCTFTSPKPVRRKSELIIIVDEICEYTLGEAKITSGVKVSAKILKSRKLG